MMTNEMRTTLYSTKVRSLALLGADIWGGVGHTDLTKVTPSHCVFSLGHTPEQSLRPCYGLWGCIPFGSLQQFKPSSFWFLFWNMEMLWKKQLGNSGSNVADCMTKDGLLAFDMVSFFKRIDLLDQMGGRDNVLNWTAPQARHWFPIFRERCNNIAEQDMLRTLRSGKYSFLVHAIPTFESPRPTALSLGMLCGRSLNNFLLSSHLLEVETGRYIRQQREQRFCQACKRSLGLRVLGDEQHALSSCVRAAVQNRDNFLLQKSYLFSLVIHYVIISTTLFSICWILWTTCQQISKIWHGN